MKGVYNYLQDKFLGNDGSSEPTIGGTLYTSTNNATKNTTLLWNTSGALNTGFVWNSNSLLLRGLQVNDFFAYENNDKDRGFLMVEYVPQEIDGLPNDMGDFSNVESTVATNNADFAKDHGANVPCVKLSDMTPYLPRCQKFPGEPDPLDRGHCDAAFDKALKDIGEYAARIETIPMKSTSHRSVQFCKLINLKSVIIVSITLQDQGVCHISQTTIINLHMLCPDSEHFFADGHPLPSTAYGTVATIGMGTTHPCTLGWTTCCSRNTLQISKNGGIENATLLQTLGRAV
jgi:hypothetical protein